ncbi:MAG: alpha/beta fold hydrolase [Chloroflexi bacterium]|nr:alpha/beta fold hydrolase [Chloroflexota bacterium]
MPTLRSVGRRTVAAALTTAPFAFAWRFARIYRERAGFPRRHIPAHDPSELGLPFEPTVVPSGELRLPAWWIPANGGAPGPAVVLVHGWESARDRTLPSAWFLHEAGFHVLTFDVRGHGLNEPEALPMSAGEFGLDALAAFRAVLERPEVTAAAIVGHSLGAIGALLAAAAEPRVAAVIATSTPADPVRLTRETFRLARLPLPNAIAYPLAWWTARVYVKPRGHRPSEVSATRAARRYRGPLLLAHGDADRVVPVGHLARLEAAARAARADDPDAGPLESLVLPDGEHSWLYEFPAYRVTVARFLAQALGGANMPERAAQLAEAVPAARLPDTDTRLGALTDEPGGLRSLARVLRPRGAGSPAARPAIRR